MNRYRLLLVGEPPIPETSGYVFCAEGDGEGPRTAARSLLKSHPAYRSVQVYDDERLVCEIRREDPAPKRLNRA